MTNNEVKGLQCPDCRSTLIQAEHVRYEPAFYFCFKCGEGKGSTDKRHFKAKARIIDAKPEEKP